MIVPRIDDRVASWDPLTDSVPIHSWLVPWLAVLGDRLQPVMAPIRQKLAKALRLWNPTDHRYLFASCSSFKANGGHAQGDPINKNFFDRVLEKK